MFRRNDRGGKGGSGKGGGALSRWGSFTRALPSLVRGNSTTANAKGGGILREQQRKRHGNRLDSKYGATMVDPNNNNSSGSHAYATAHLSSSFYEQSRHPRQQPKSPSAWSEEEEDEEEEDGEEEQCHRRHRHDFSLKQSLRKSGSRLFNGILKGGYFRALLGDDDEEEEEADGDDEEDGAPDGRYGRRKEAAEEEEEAEELRLRQDLLNNNNGTNAVVAGANFGVPSNDAVKSSAPPPPLRLRPSNTAFFPHPVAKSSASTTIGTSALRSSLRQAKRHLLAPGGQNAVAGTGLVSSMLLAMAAGQPPPAPPPIARPFDRFDWNGNNAVGAIRNPAAAELFTGQRKKVIQASSSELIRALGHFIGQNCRPGIMGQFEPGQLSTWLRGVDRALILQGWQDVAFINPANLVFLFLLLRDAIGQGECQRVGSLRELHSFVLLCLYISYSYMGNEISYPLKPFITENTNRALFWSQCVRLIKRHSGQMLRLNSSSTFFLEVFTELKAYCPEYSMAIRSITNNAAYS